MALFTLLFLLFICGFGLTSGNDLPKVVESLSGIPQGWSQGNAPAPTEMVKLRLAMDQPLLADFHQLVHNISTPDHPSYGNHLSKREVDDMLRPSSEASNAITAWLEGAGVESRNIKLSGHWITFDTTVAIANALLDTKFYYYHDGSVSLIRTLQYSVPSSLRTMIETIQPTTRFGQPQAQANLVIRASTDEPSTINPGFLTRYDDEFCNTTITPACIQGLYQMSSFTASPKGATKLGVSGYIEQGAYFQDLTDFISNVEPSLKSNDFSIVSIDDGITAQKGVNSTAEANLDVQYAVTLAPGTPVVYYSTGGRAPIDPDLDQPTVMSGANEPYLDQLHYLLALNDSDLPDVLSTSYAEDEESVPYNYAVQVCNLFAQLAARGVSVIFSSGDTGVGSACQSNDGRKTTRFSPTFPATCPWVTSVGGTYALKPEIAAEFSAGGFSFYFARPSYQEPTVPNYLAKLGKTNQEYFNSSGRGYPDVSAQSVRYIIWNQGQPEFLYGTSCAAPTFAAVVSNLNNIRLAAGKSKLGFLNPWLYTIGVSGLTDITHGQSSGCSGIDIYTGKPAGRIPNAHWVAVPGWDPVTGLGTPNFQRLSGLL